MDLGDLIRFLIVILIVVIPLVSQILAKLRNQNPPPPPVGGPRPRAPQEDFKQEIEDFLRRAAEGRQPKRPAPTRTAQQPPRRSAAGPPPVPKPAKPPEPAPVGGSVVEHVKKHLDTSEFSRRTAQLGDEVAQADDKVDARMHDVFQHQLGQFDWRTTGDADAASAPTSTSAAGAAGLALLLANPENVRQAIVLNEILQRPEQRWT